MHKNNPLLTQGVWKVGSGLNIAFKHPAWFIPKQTPSPNVNTVAELIDQENSSWKSTTVRQLYDKER